MQDRTANRTAVKRLCLFSVLIGVVILLAPAATAQQTYVTRYDAYIGYANLQSPKINLSQHGIQMQIGMRPTTWYSVGFDYSHVSGDMTLTPSLLPTAQQQLLAAILPPGYQLVVPASAVTQSFSMGPQLAFRHFSKVTLFLRPSMGAVRERATPRPKDPLSTMIVKALSPNGEKTDWQGFYGVGYGFDILFSNHFALRAQGDLVWDHLFNDILREGRWTTRFSVGPCFNFGRNIAEARH
jgi:hypothetical protein